MTERAGRDTPAHSPGGAESYAPLVVGCLLAVPTLVAHYLPMTDLALHEGAVGLLRHFGDDAYAPPGLYRLNLGHPNQLFYVAAWLLSYVVGTTWAVKLVVAAAQIAIFWAGGRLADHLGRSRWSVLLLAPLALGFTYYWGLTANLLGFAALLGVLPGIDRAATEPSGRGVARSCALLMLAFFAHESIFLAASVFIGLLAAAYPLDRRKTALRLAPVGFAVAVAIGHQIYASRFFTGSGVSPPAQFASLWSKVANLPGVLFGSHDAPVRLVLLGLSLVAVVILVEARVRSKEAAPEGVARPEAERGLGRAIAWARYLVLRYRYELTGLVFLAMYVALPFNWRGATLLYERFLGPAWALLVICAGPRRAAPRLAKIVSCVVPVAVLLVAWPQFADADHTYRDLDALIAEVPKSSAVAIVVVERRKFHERVFAASSGAARVVADRGGRAGLSLAISPISPVQFDPRYRWDEFDQRMFRSEALAFQPATDLDRFGWVIASSREPEMRAVIAYAFLPDAEVVAERGEWMLLRSTHPQLPLTSGDGPAHPRVRTIIQRITSPDLHE